VQQLQRSYIFEFAGMPQSGKTVVKDIFAHYLKRMEYPFEAYHGGSKNSPDQLYYGPIGELNQWLAEKTARFVRSIATDRNTAHKIFLLDRGLIDRCIFTEALVQAGKVPERQAEEIYKSLLFPDLLEKLDGVFIFVSSPETALIREYHNKLVKRENVRSEGEVMNESFLSSMRSAAETWNERVKKDDLVENVEIIDTEQHDLGMRATAREVFDIIRHKYPELGLK